MRINNNLMALNAHRQLGVVNTAGNKSMEKLSSGLRINRAGDDAAGLAISEKMRGQIRGLNQASRNAQDGISLIQTAEGALTETHAILQRMRELAVQSSSDTNVDTLDREAIQNEFSQLKLEIDRIGNDTEFNTQKLLNGGGASAPAALTATATGTGEVSLENIQSVTEVQTLTIDTPFEAGDTLEIGGVTYTFGSGDSFDVDTDTIKSADDQAAALAALIANQDGIASATADGAAITITQSAPPAGDGFSATFQIGANETQTMTIEIADMRSDALELTNVSLATGSDAREAITSINNAINKVSTQRSNLGAYQNRLEHTIKNLDNSAENLQAAESRVRDVDMAKEMMEFTKNNILQQAAQAMLAQANQAPQGVLQLLR